MEVKYEKIADSIKYTYFKLSTDVSDGKKSNAVTICENESYKTMIPPHFHKSLEIKLILNGEAIIGVDGEEKKLCVGQLCFVDAYKVHYYVYNKHKGNEMQCYDLVFNSELIQYIIGENKTFPTIIDNAKTYTELLKLYEEVYPKFSQYDEYQRAGFIIKVIGILMSNEKVLEKENNSETNLSREIITYIYTHYKEPIEIKTLAKEFGYTEGYMSLLFKKITNCNFRDYLNKYRITVADSIKEENPKKSLREISEEVGYTSWVTFFRAYKRYSKNKV